MADAPVKSSCPHCGQAVRVPASLVGKNVRCPKCTSVFAARAETDAAIAIPPAPPPPPPLPPPPPPIPRVSPADNGATVGDEGTVRVDSSDLDFAIPPQPDADGSEFELSHGGDTSVSLLSSPAADAKDPPSLATPTPKRSVLGDYEIIDTIGQGGMSVVYLGRHRHLDRRVAIKVLPGAFLRSSESVDRLLREARIGAQLRHPNICQILDARLEDGEFYFVMEYVPGDNLQKLCRNQPLPIGRACHLARQLFDALKYLAAQNIVHRDIKPSNLIVTPENQLKLLDLGLAKVAEEAEGGDLTHAGQLIGTPAFMAPEQITDVRNVSPAMDLYAGGMTLFMMVTGTYAFTGTHIPELLTQIVTSTPPNPRTIRPDLPQPVGDLIWRLLAKSAADRPSHDEVIQTLSLYADEYGDSVASAAKPQTADDADAVSDTRMLGADRVDRILHAVENAERQLKQDDADELLSVMPQVNGDIRLGEFFVRKRIGRKSSINTFSGEMPLGKVPCILRVFPPAFGAVTAMLDTLLEEQGRLMQVSMKSSHLTTLLYIGKATLARGTVRDLYYTVENYVPGTTFEQMISAGERLGLREARRCLLQAAAGLWTLHEGQILHGNLHPAKFLYDPEAQELCICDITRARIVKDDLATGASSEPEKKAASEDDDSICESRATATRTWLGSGNRYWFSDCSSLRRQYIAPEIFSENQAASFASEQYSLGVVFIEAMTGSFIRTDPDNLKLYNRVRADLEDRLDEIAEESPRFAQTLRKLVKPNAASRYPDLRELRRVLLAGGRDPNRLPRKPSGEEYSGSRSRGAVSRTVEKHPRRSTGGYDVFISYRREGGAETSRAIKERLQREGFSVFLDVDRLKSGHFDVTLLRHIENTRNFLVVLSKDSLERARQQPNDWLRREIAHAIRCRRNVIPLMAQGFKMPNAEDLPYDLRQLVKFNAISYEHEHFDGVIEQLLEFLRSPA